MALYVNMNKEEIINNAYKEFSFFERPMHFTDYKHCEECEDHDETMRSCNLRDIGAKEVGNPGWSPLPLLTEHALGYVMPRLIEMALNLEKNADGDIFIFDFLLCLTPNKEYKRFNNYSSGQINIIQQCLKYIKNNYTSYIDECMCEEELQEAISTWCQ